MAIPPPFDLLPSLLRGVGITVQLTLISAVFAFFVSFIVGFARLSRIAPLRWISSLYVELLRGTSLLVQLFWAYFVLPLPPFNLRLSAMEAGIIVFSLNLGAYGSEVVRSSILAIPNHQREAGIALNMTNWQIMFRIILPQAFLIMLPSFGNLLIELLKGTALVSMITLSDLMFQGTQLRVTTMRNVEVFSLVLVIYFLLAYPLAFAVRRIENRLSRKGA